MDRLAFSYLAEISFDVIFKLSKLLPMAIQPGRSSPAMAYLHQASYTPPSSFSFVVCCGSSPPPCHAEHGRSLPESICRLKLQEPGVGRKFLAEMQ
jgi:hypothetical protein